MHTLPATRITTFQAYIEGVLERSGLSDDVKLGCVLRDRGTQKFYHKYRNLHPGPLDLDSLNQVGESDQKR